MTEYDDSFLNDSGCDHCAPPQPVHDLTAPLTDPAPVAPLPPAPPVLDFPVAAPLDLGHGADTVQTPVANDLGATIVGPAPGVGDLGDVGNHGGDTITVGGPTPGIDPPGSDHGAVTTTVGGPTPGIDPPSGPETLTFGGATPGLGPVGHGTMGGDAMTVVTGDNPNGGTTVALPNPDGDPAAWGFGRPGAGTPPLGFDPRSPVNDPDPNPTI